MQAFAVIVSEDDDVQIKTCDISKKHTIVVARVPDPEKKEGQIALGVSPTQRPDGLVALPPNALWFDDLGVAAKYLKGIVADPKLPDALKLEPITDASGVIIVNVFPEPFIHDGILDVQVHAYPNQYVPLKELLAGMAAQEEASKDIETPRPAGNKVVEFDMSKSRTGVVVDAEVKDVEEESKTTVAPDNC